MNCREKGSEEKTMDRKDKKKFEQYYVRSDELRFHDRDDWRTVMLPT